MRQQFVAAMERVRLRLAELPDTPILQRSVIYDYLLAARLRRDVEMHPDEHLDAAIDAFLQAHTGQPVARALRNDWLASLAVRRRWDWFLPRATGATSAQLVCDRLQGRLETADTRGLAAEALARWIQPQRQPPECDPIFAWLRREGLLTPALAETRTRAALAAENPRLAREFAAEISPQQAQPLLRWAELLDAPKSALALLLANPSLPVESAALESGFARLARTDFTAAAAVLPPLLARPDMTPTLQARLQRSAALGAAYGRDPAAVAAFNELPPAALDNDVQEWRARAALWAGDYRKALQWIEQMPAGLAGQPRWRYWRARAIAATAGYANAMTLYTEIAGMRDYYGYLAADRIQKPYALNARATTDDQSIQSALAAQPGLIRAHALLECELSDDAGAEWSGNVAGTEPAVKVQAARLAARWGWYAQSIATLAQSGELDDVRLRYPRPYSAAVAEAGKLTQLPSDWILAVMRQESLFRSDAVSRAGARGLMQMLPSTALAVAHRWHLPAPRMDAKDDFSADVERGAAYLRELLDRHGGQLSLGLAAYNAGPVSVARWLPSHPVDADVWIENIPYGETRNYVQRILEHIVAFAWVRAAEVPRLATLLPKVAPGVAAARSGEVHRREGAAVALASKHSSGGSF